MSNAPADPYPARLEIDYPERLDRLTSLLRPLTAIPALLLLYVMPAAIALPLVMMILVRRKYPRWWFDFNLERTRFSARFSAYLLLLTDRYPSTDDEQSVHLDLDDPGVAVELSRWLPLVKWLLALPHYIVLALLQYLVLLVVLLAWLAIALSGRFPRALFEFVVGYLRWSLRVQAYTSLLITDRYPPFRLAP